MERYAYKFAHRPDFLRDCFFWKGRGYRYADTLPPEVADPGARSGNDPWIALASVIEAAKRGDYGGIPYLKRWAQDETVNPTLSAACLDVIADAGSKADLEFLANLMLDGPDHLRISSCHAAQWAGSLWLLPFMLEAWLVLKRRADRSAVEANLCNLLEPAEGEQTLFDGELSDSEHAELVIRQVSALQSATGTDDISILGGKPVDMNQLIWSMRKTLATPPLQEWRDWSPFLLWRRKFEAYTGEDCSGFYGQKGEFRPLNVAATLDRYMASNPSLNFEVGQRYFFGRRIP